MEWSVGGLGQGSSKFFNFFQTRKIGPIWPILTEFDRFRVFNLILHVIYMLTLKIIWFYESTRDFDNNAH